MAHCLTCDGDPCVCEGLTAAVSPEVLAEIAAIRAARCPTCRGERWLCEDHPTEPFEHDDCGGAGIACHCNPERAVEWQEIYAEVPQGPLH